MQLNYYPESSFGSPGGTIACRSTDVRSRIKKQEKVRIGSWNVRTMYQAEKIHNAIKEMDRINISIIGISEMRLPDSGNIDIENHKVLYSGSTTETHEYGVGIILAEKMVKSIKNFIPISSRAILVQLLATPVDVNIIQVYAPTADKEDNDIEEFYQSINEVMNKLKKQDFTIVMGDFNAKLGADKTSVSVGPFGLGETNNRGDRLEIFAETNTIAVMNTWRNYVMLTTP